MIVKAISVRPPWSHFISRLPRELAKDVENRSWSTTYRGPLLIHASKGCTRAEYEDAITFAESFTDVAQELFPDFGTIERGGIVGAVRLCGVIAPEADEHAWHVPGCFGLEFEGHVALPFRPLRGALGLFNVELTPAEADALRAAGLVT